jgi:hypothetical protein
MGLVFALLTWGAELGDNSEDGKEGGQIAGIKNAGHSQHFYYLSTRIN